MSTFTKEELRRINEALYNHYLAKGLLPMKKMSRKVIAAIVGAAYVLLGVLLWILGANAAVLS